MTTQPVQPAPVTLVVGGEELLADRAVGAVIRAVRDLDPEADVRQLDAVGLPPGEITTLVSPSLFGERKVIVVRGVAQAGEDVVAELKAYVAAPADDVALVLLHKGGAKGKALLDAARKAGAAEVACAEVKTRRDRHSFVMTEFRTARRRVQTDAADALLDAVGNDLRSLASACAQLVADTTGTVDLELVSRYYEGRAEVTGFTVADRAVEGRSAEALAQLRWALASGTEPVLIVSALATALRNIVKLAVAPAGLRPADLARELGMPPWKVDVVRRQVRGWEAEGVAAALLAVAEADAQVKGAGGDPLYALERAVVTVARSRAR
jgi:DNA polymerase III delta subunit